MLRHTLFLTCACWARIDFCELGAIEADRLQARVRARFSN